MEPKNTLWPLEPHTVGKHLVLRRYLDAWLPIMGSSQRRILIIDGFAGPGVYAGGEEGSPLVALRAFVEHQSRGRITAEVRFVFIEKDRKRKEYLAGRIASFRPRLPEQCKVDVVEGVFDATMTSALNQLEVHQRQLAPAFVMVDPFGVSDTPMEVISRILKNRKSEVYISFMYDALNRFKRTAEFEPHLDRLFGCAHWRRGIDLAESEERKRLFYNLYKAQLRNAGAGHVVHFDLYEGRRLVYAIFFATQSTTGCDRMKQAIWKVAPWGDFCFRGSSIAQPTLGLEEPDFAPLRQLLVAEFGRRDWVSIEEIEEFVKSDRTDYHSSQVRRGVLVPMEGSGAIEVDETTRKRKRTYPAGSRVRFVVTPG